MGGVERPYVHRYMNNSIFYRIHTAFEVKVRSQSLRHVEFDTSCTSGLESSQFKTWTTKEANACILIALLLRLVPV